MFCTSINVLGLYLSLKNTAHINHCHKSLKRFQKFSGNFCKYNYAHGQHKTIESACKIEMVILLTVKQKND